MNNAPLLPSKPVLILFTVVIFLLPLYVRSLWEAKKALDFLNVSSLDTSGQIAELKRAVSWDSPFNPYAREAKRRFYQLSTQITDRSQKLDALRELRSALKSSRSFLRPEQELNQSQLLATVEQEIAQLEGPRSSLKETYPARVNYPAQILAQIFFWSWIGLIGVGIFKGFSKDGLPNYRSLATFFPLALIAYCLWLLSLRFVS